MSFAGLFVLLLLPTGARAESIPPAPPPLDPALFSSNVAPPPLPILVELPPPPPSPQALATWEAQQLGRAALAHPPEGWTDAVWGIRTGGGRYLTAAEFAAVTGDADGTLALRRHLSAARNDRGWLYAIGGVLEVVALAELAGAGTRSAAEEDHLWRGLVLAGVGAVPIAIGPFRVRAEQDRARHVALNYTAGEADHLIVAYNSTLRSQLGIPAVVVGELPVDADRRAEDPAMEDAP